MEQEVKFQVEIRVQDMYRFLMRHAYYGLSGIINLIISGGAFVLFLLGKGTGSPFGNAMLLLIAALFTIINPIFLYYKAAKQVKLTPMFKKPLDYIINDKGITVRQGEEELPIEWTHVYKVIETNKDFYIYLSLTRAYILPKNQYTDKVELVKKLLQIHGKGKNWRLKKNER